jgi:hypothetical protein
MHIEVETQNVEGQVTALGSAGPFTLVVDRPVEGGGGGLGFNGGQLRYHVGDLRRSQVRFTTPEWKVRFT